jgi:DNA-binding protein HU-beta
MNKTELIQAVNSKLDTKYGASQQRSGDYLDAFLETIGDTLKAGEKVTITGFGTFTPKDTAARPGRNPKTGEPLQVEASRKVRFTPGKELKDKIHLA